MYNEDKDAFVKELGELLAKFGVEDVMAMYYQKDDWKEVVEVKFWNGQSITVNVHMDSLDAIVIDVMNALQFQ